MYGIIQGFLWKPENQYLCTQKTLLSDSFFEFLLNIFGFHGVTMSWLLAIVSSGILSAGSF
ncbi:MAG: hypothetical protein K2W82_01475 [Candidatus Obscuribacterales bacterium]|nr:hypothetical protein [Candidatus Obscuribacterales bacterium]